MCFGLKLQLQVTYLKSVIELFVWAFSVNYKCYSCSWNLRVAWNWTRCSAQCLCFHTYFRVTLNIEHQLGERIRRQMCLVTFHYDNELKPLCALNATKNERRPDVNRVVLYKIWLETIEHMQICLCMRHSSVNQTTGRGVERNYSYTYRILWK
jgi:hypothetical protein